MKVNYSAYEIGSKVYAISRRYVNKKPSDTLAIYEAVVKDVCIMKDKDTNTIKTEYMLTTPYGDEWGDVVNGDGVDEDFYSLVEKVKKEWMNNSNTFDEE